MANHHQPAAGILFVLFLIWMLFPESDTSHAAHFSTSSSSGSSLSGSTASSASPPISDVAAARLSRYGDALREMASSHWGDFSPSPFVTEGYNPDTDTNTDPEALSSNPTPSPNLKTETTTTTTTQQPRYINLTGFRPDDGFAWQDLPRFREHSLRLSRYAIPPVAGRQLWDEAQGEAVWANASGTLRGDWIRRPGSVSRAFDSYNLTRSVPGVSWVGDGAEWARNLTGRTGRMTLRLEGNKTVTTYNDDDDDEAEFPGGGVTPRSGGVIRDVKGTITLEDTTGSGLSWEMGLWGTHWPRQGVILLTTASDKFDGIFALPHLAPAPSFFHSSRALLSQTLSRVVVARKQASLLGGSSSDHNNKMPWSSDVDNSLYTSSPSPHCEFVVYAQVHPPSRQSLARAAPDLRLESAEKVIAAIEAELQSPEGAPIRSVPRLKMSALLYSPDCAFFLETRGPPGTSPAEADHLVGTKTEVHTHQVKTWMLIYALVVLAQVRLLKNQMRESYTPSTMGRISFWTVSAMAMVDGMTFTAAATWVSSAAATFLPTLALMFASFLSMTIGGSFLAKIHEVQVPESRARQQQQAPPPAARPSVPVQPPPPPPPPPPRSSSGGRSTRDSGLPSHRPAPIRTTSVQTASGPPSTGPATPALLNPVSPLTMTFANARQALPPPPSSRRPSSQPVIVPSDQDVDAEIAANAASGASAVPSALPTPADRSRSSGGSGSSFLLSYLPASASATAQTPSPRQTPTFQAIVGRFILFTLCISFLAISSSTWYPRARVAFLNLLAFAYLSFWLPQIYRNTARNCRRAMSWQFVVGQSLLRLLPVAYFWVKEDNFLYARTDRLAFLLLCAWVGLQTLVLAGQEILGPRFGVPPSWTSEAWDYHPVLREDTVEAGGLPIGLVTANTEDDVKFHRSSSSARGSSASVVSRRSSNQMPSATDRRASMRTIDCAICREVLQVPVLTSSDEDGTVASVFARRLYMVTPCRHIFHTTCLEGWMRFRLQCPICREELPPI